jgi:hypothetical protein
MDTVKVGDTVLWKGAFGMQPAQKAKVVMMELTPGPRQKYGEDVEKVSWDMVHQNRVLFTLDNGHWAYSDQIVARCV